MSQSDPHRTYLTALLGAQPGLSTRGFRAQMNIVMELISGHEEWFKPRELLARPDAFLIRFDKKVVEVYEVLVTHPCSQRTLQEYADLDGAFEFHQSGWRLLLFVVDRYGRIHPEPLSLDEYRS